MSVIVIFVISIILILLIIALIVIDDKFARLVLAFLTIMFAICLGGFIESVSHDDEPTTIDVYRGKTQLKIIETRLDSVVVSKDTIIIFK